MDQCKHCTLRGNLNECEKVECAQHDSWYVKELKLNMGKTSPIVEQGGLASFGAAVLEYMKPLIADGMMDETLEDIAQLAVGNSVLKEVEYDPEIHIDMNPDYCDFEPGDKIYYWGKEASA